MSDVLGVPVGQAVTPRGLVDVGFGLDAGRVLLAVLVLAVVVAVGSRYARTVTATAGVMLLAVAGALVAPVRPPDLLITAALLLAIATMAAWSALRPEAAPA